MLTGFYIRARAAISSLSYRSAAVIGAAIGGLIILLGGHFHIGSWFLTGAPAYVPAMLSGAVTALLIRYVLKPA